MHDDSKYSFSQFFKFSFSQTLNMADKTKASDWQVILKTSTFSIVILAIGLFACLFVEKGLQNFSPAYADDIRVAAMLFIIWLVVSSAIKSASSIKRSIDGWKLILMGTAIAVIGTFIYTVVKGYFPDLIWNTSSSVVYPFQWNSFAFFSGIGAILALTSVIRLRVGSKFWKTVLIWLVYIGIAVVVYSFGK